MIRSFVVLGICATLFMASVWNFLKLHPVHIDKRYHFDYSTNHPQSPTTVGAGGHGTAQEEHRRLQEQDDRFKILYMVTSLAEYDNGRRATVEGRDRFSETVVPVVVESAQSMNNYNSNNEVTVYFICHYKLSNRRYQELRRALPASIQLYVWDNATPIGYAKDNEDVVPNNQVDVITRALARQHRFIIKDLLLKYDMFVAFEDDMLIKGEHVAYYQQTTQQLYDLRFNAPKSLPTDQTLFYGPMTQMMLRRMLPGFIRVEVAPSADWQPKRQRHNPQANSFPHIPIDYDWNLNGADSSQQARLDPSICCHRPPNGQSQSSPTIEQLRYWETSIKALGVRQMPDKSWVLLQAGNDERLYPDLNLRIGEFWTGQNHETEYFGEEAERPNRSSGDYLNNQGGWMATRRQIIEWHTERCFGGFLPPYAAPQFLDDGLATATVEFWSGGIELVGIKACNLQRMIPLDPPTFSHALLYHTSNNKQRQKYVQHRFAGTHIQAFWGQLNAIRKNAETQKRHEIEQLKAQFAAGG
mmetsp:Transcript_35904/g.74660  ORF Transcript_35904/g.74660 Transcript_35904/m.74660 type:complete len:527 (-) Transcript_35904:1165-2745(-)